MTSQPSTTTATATAPSRGYEGQQRAVCLVQIPADSLHQLGQEHLCVFHIHNHVRSFLATPMLLLRPASRHERRMLKNALLSMTHRRVVGTLHGKPQYWDTYSASYSPVGQWVPPEYVASASGFYENLLLTRKYWKDTLQHEGMSDLKLPSTQGGGGSTNGTWLVTQAVHSIVRSMISRDDTWHGRYGVLPGYGISMQDGFQDTFTATMTGALEMGSMAYVCDGTTCTPPPPFRSCWLADNLAFNCASYSWCSWCHVVPAYAESNCVPAFSGARPNVVYASQANYADMLMLVASSHLTPHSTP